MKKVMFGKLMLLVILVISIMATMSITALAAKTEADFNTELAAAGITDDTWDSEYIAYAQSNATESWINIYFTTNSSAAEYEGKEAFTTDINGNSTTFYYKAGTSVSRIKGEVEQSKSSAAIVDKTLEITNGIDVEADTRTGSQILEGFVPIINTILGVIVVLITLGLAVFTSFDVCYIVFPVFRNKCEDQKMSGQGAMVSKAANGDSKLRFVSDEAQYVVQECNVSQGKNPLSTYLGKRVVAYIIVAIILFILLTGNISIITNIALKVVSGIMKVLGSLAS